MVTLPRIPGHEVAGTILQCGTDVPAQWEPGTKVTLSPYTNCGKCSSCRRNRPNASSTWGSSLALQDHCNNSLFHRIRSHAVGYEIWARDT
jgi:threonine dehydrogenase-like Zn-dependent dehydrogenase